MSLLKRFAVLGFAATMAVSFTVQAAAAERKSKKKSDDSGAAMPDTKLIDVPTAGIIEYYGLQVESRFFRNGGLLGGLNFGVLPRLNLGATMSVDQFIGNSSDARLIKPEIQAKYRFYDGGGYVPAMAVGYDGQGYYYDRNTKKYLEKGKGLYVAGSHEILPKFMLNPGINVSDFDTQNIFLFFGTSYTIEESFAVMAEWDNVQRFDESRLNAGVRFYVTPFFLLDFAVRGIWNNDTLSDGTRRSPERIVQIKYSTSF